MDVFRKYFELPETEQSLGISIKTLGHHIHPKNISYPDPKHPDSYYFEWEKGRKLTEFQLLYVSKGEGYFETDEISTVRIEAGTIFLLYPGVWHRYKPNPETGWEEHWVGFSGIYAEYLLEQECFSPQNPIIKIGFNNEFFETFSKLIEVVEVKDKSYQTLSSFLLIQLLGIVYASALLSRQRLSKKEIIIQEIRNEIHEKWYTKIDFENLATKKNVSYIWFRKTFKELMGVAPLQYQLNIKIKKAEQLVKDTNCSLSEIAYQCGFDSEFYFSRIFKAKTGKNASELRKKITIQ